MMPRARKNTNTILACLLLLVVGIAGCAQFQLPRIDPLGRSIFLSAPNSTSILSPMGATPPQNYPQPYAVAPGIQAPVAQGGPAFVQPAPVPSCANGNCGASLGRPHIQPTGSLISHGGSGIFHNRSRKPGTLATTPSRIVAPVGSEVVVMAGVCGNDGYYIINQPLEWMLSQDSAGQIVEVGGMEHSLFNKVVQPSSKKFAGNYAWGRTGLKPKLIDRGTDTPVDDLQVQKGQTWLSLTSASEGTSYLTCVAPKCEAWPERKSITRIHWVDGLWSIPMPSSATAGTIHQIASQVNRTSDGTGVEGWKVRYQIVGGVPAEFHPDGTQSAEVTTNSSGLAPIQIRQPAGKAVAGPTQVRTEVVRPGVQGSREVVLESGITTVNWSSPALTIRAIGPRTAGINQPFNYRIEVTNPGDQVARDVVVTTEDIVDRLEYISSTPKPEQYGNRYEWKLGDIQPGGQPKVIDIQMRSDEEGPRQLCFETASLSDQLKTEACAETQIAVPCIGLKINGPTQASVGDEMSFNFDITNQCDRPLENVTIQLQYDTGLAADGVPNPAELTPIARILPGETVNLPPLTFRALQGGTQCFNMEIRSAAGDTSRARRCVEVENVTQSRVRIDMQSHGTVRVGEQALVKMKVSNVGNVPLDDVTLLNSFSRSMTPAQRSAIPQTWIGDDMAFALGRIEPGQSKDVEILFDTNRADGDAYSRATVTTPMGASDQTGVSIRIEPADGSGAGAARTNPSNGSGVGIPADPVGGGLQIGVNALDRTVAVNNTTTFQVAVQNDRAFTDQNVVISMLIPPGARLMAIDPIQTGLRIASQSADGSVVEFEPRNEMRAGETLNFPITLQFLRPGQATFAVQAVSARSPDSIEATDTISVIP